MAEFLHELVRKREQRTVPSLDGGIFNSIIRDMQEQYNSGRLSHTRAQESIDRYMENNTPSMGMTLNMPVLDINASANASLVMQHITYVYTGGTGMETHEEYRGWRRVN